ncbi:MAG: hypothetical protein FWF56_05445 [Firmicutes bacterium]|nr:hypothetical protein [Bacillota bacterium]MCL1953861.1 hypothetical protein [Bacillota bacterium]
MAIPKKIHYVWLGGGELSDLHKRCIATWSEICPDYEIIRWDESNYDVNINPLVVNAISAKNWALAADYIRVDVLHRYGGIYLDTDVELVKSFDHLLYLEFFVGYEHKSWCSNAIIGSEPNSIILNLVMSIYMQDINVSKYSNVISIFAFSTVFKKYLDVKNNGKTTIIDDKYAVFSFDYFYPYQWLSKKLKSSDNTVCIHWYNGSWLTEKQVASMNFLGLITKVIGRKFFNFIESIVVGKYYRLCIKRLNFIYKTNQVKNKLSTDSI